MHVVSITDNEMNSDEFSVFSAVGVLRIHLRLEVLCVYFGCCVVQFVLLVGCCGN